MSIPWNQVGFKPSTDHALALKQCHYITPDVWQDTAWAAKHPPIAQHVKHKYVFMQG